ncbi:intraflagellar transport protein 140 homolog [Centruroides sculpturatus]|uniref:intraflagellar transport protein 140 homolog n=1 Tax=Centruroides sculpturatus TaxID=218467 RepID=UPI000C6EF4FF|nr:intraflagellar transport protein 140 homolog [Centruroides sculpturatus]
MEIFLDYKIENASSNAALNTYLSWHRTHPLLCVSSFDQEKGGILSVYGEDGTAVDAGISFKVGLQITSVAWHPVRKIIAYGWENGEIVLWNGKTEILQNETSKHKTPVLYLQWSDGGGRLVSVDSDGTCVGWRLVDGDRLGLVFCHELKDGVTDVLFRGGGSGDGDGEISRLLRAAVDGDEDALNVFCDWRRPAEGRTSARGDSGELFLGCSSGAVFYVDGNGNCADVLAAESGIRKLLHYSERNRLIVVTESLNLVQYQIGEEGNLTELTRVKLSGKSADVGVIWTCPSILAVNSGERVMRLWNLENGSNFVLSLDDSNLGESSEALTCMAYDDVRSVLSAGTSHGHVLIWKYKPDNTTNGFERQEENWKLQPFISVQGAVRMLNWGTSKRILGVLTATDVYVLVEEKMSYSFRDNVVAVQTSARRLSLTLLSTDKNIELQTDVHVKAVFVNSNFVSISSGNQLYFYEISKENIAKFVGSFNSKSQMVALHEHSAFVMENGKIEVYTFQGTSKQSLVFTEEEGPPVCIDISNNFLVSGTTNGFLKLWDISRREAKPHAGPKSLASILKDDGDISLVKCNGKGNKVSISIVRLYRGEMIPDPVIHVWDVDSDYLFHFDFSNGRRDDSDSSESASYQSSTWKLHFETAQIINGRFPFFHCWDPDDSQLLICEARLQHVKHTTRGKIIEKNVQENISIDWNTNSKTMVVSFFTTSEQGLLIQDHFALNESTYILLGVQVPYYILLQKSHDSRTDSSDFKIAGESTEKMPVVVKQTMKDFIGLEDCDKVTRNAIMSFSYFLTVGNMDEAFKAIKVIKNESVWENMARMCVKTKRLDVASVCLGKMGHARGAKAIRETADEPELDARVAILATQLGMLKEAEHLLQSSNRFDLLNKLYQDSGQWTKAIEMAEHRDRVHLRSTYYNYARHLEAKGDIASAIPMYEKSETHYFEIPRMLFEEPHVLEGYILKSKDKELHKWWAQYLESIGEMETALQFYEAAQDYLSLVRLYCYCNNLEKASEIANETGHRAACFHLGRQFENQDNIKEAVHFFSRARAYNNAVRICKEHGLEDQLLNLALMSGPQVMNEVAHYYEEHSEHREKAIMLYHKAGYLNKAIELAFRTQEFDALQSIASNLSENTDPQLLHKCAQFFMENKQYDKAVDLLADAKKYIEALELCVEHNVFITEELAEKLTLDKDSNSELRTQILEKIGECCMLQNNYHLAAKKFTQAGKKIQAMKSLLKSGDTEKIIFFTGVSRQKEIYVMAANYLQSLDWRQDPEIMKNIINFYTKGKAPDLLAGFYEACAQVEMDEYQNYEKALGALHEAFKCLSKAQNNLQITDKIENLKIKMELLKRFVQARQLYKANHIESVQQCQNLLTEENVDMAIHKGDIYGFLVEHYVREQNYKTAHTLIEEMQAKLPGINLPYYINADVLKAIYKALNIQPASHISFLEESKTSNETAEASENEIEEEYGEESGY